MPCLGVSLPGFSGTGSEAVNLVCPHPDSLYVLAPYVRLLYQNSLILLCHLSLLHLDLPLLSGSVTVPPAFAPLGEVC